MHDDRVKYAQLSVACWTSGEHVSSTLVLRTCLFSRYFLLIHLIDHQLKAVIGLLDSIFRICRAASQHVGRTDLRTCVAWLVGLGLGYFSHFHNSRQQQHAYTRQEKAIDHPHASIIMYQKPGKIFQAVYQANVIQIKVRSWAQWHIDLDIPVLVQSLKSSNVELGDYLYGSLFKYCLSANP